MNSIIGAGNLESQKELQVTKVFYFEFLIQEGGDILYFQYNFPHEYDIIYVHQEYGSDRPSEF